MPKLFDVGGQYPPEDDIERLSKYKRCKKIFDGKGAEVYERASEILRDTPAAAQIEKLYIAVNLMDVLTSKPGDLMIGDPPTFESGESDDTKEQKALNSIVEENDVLQLIHEVVVGAGIRGDSWLKVRYGLRNDVSETVEAGLIPPIVKYEPIIEPVDASLVFPELSKHSRKKFKAINIAFVVTEQIGNKEFNFLKVERHVPGYILFEKYLLEDIGVVSSYDVPIPIYKIVEQVETGRDEDVISTGVDRPLIFHVPYKSVDDDWRGIGGIEKLESVLAAINDRIVQIDYILWKHADPIAYGPDDIDGGDDGGNAVRWGGKYIPVGKEDVTPGYMTWSGELDAAFKELDMLLSIVFVQSETPQWLFGTVISGSDKGGSGTSHTDGAAIKARFMPILSKVRRIRTHVDRALRDALWTAMVLENYANEGIEGFTPYDPVYPKINWRDGIPKNEKEEAEIYQIRTGNKPTLDAKSAIKRMDSLDDMQAEEIAQRIEADEKAAGYVDSSVFNRDVGADE